MPFNMRSNRFYDSEFIAADEHWHYWPLGVPVYNCKYSRSQPCKSALLREIFGALPGPISHRYKKDPSIQNIQVFSRPHNAQNPKPKSTPGSSTKMTNEPSNKVETCLDCLIEWAIICNVCNWVEIQDHKFSIYIWKEFTSRSWALGYIGKDLGFLFNIYQEIFL